MILLYTQVGELSEEQLDFLVDNLEEEWPEDRDYYINRAMLEILKQRGADAALLHILEQALGNREEVDILWVDTDELEEIEEDEDGF
jgi:processive 1,2-diacylglycerol beta-glucosyltransferase